jgi:orotidine-5'-phosphate decarboxylase
MDDNKGEMINRLCLALDVASKAEAQSIVREVSGKVGLFKVGLELYAGEGPDIVETIRSLGGKVFLDLKLHDIPNTVARAARSVTRLGVTMLNVHASGGSEMMRAAADSVREEAAKMSVPVPFVLGVTVLTSLSSAQLSDELQVKLPLESQVVWLAKLARQSGLDGVVASPQETRLIREACGPRFLIVTPGIRPIGAASGDQKRFTTPSEAMSLGADFIVVGRPILLAKDRLQACDSILAEMESFTR